MYRRTLYTVHDPKLLPHFLKPSMISTITNLTSLQSRLCLVRIRTLSHNAILFLMPPVSEQVED